MTRGRSVLRSVSCVLVSVLFLLTIVAFFVLPILSDREARERLGDENAFVTDTARSPWIYVEADGTALVNSDSCIGMEEIVVPCSVNGITVTRFSFQYTTPPACVKKITFPTTLRAIESHPFQQWHTIEEIVFQEGIENLGNLVIGQKPHLKKLVLPRSVKKLHPGMFLYKEHPVVICYAGTEEEWSLVRGALELSGRHTVIYEYGAENQN